jgi:uncharacterized membrane protein YphA (DoxX/SURF4 family)
MTLRPTKCGLTALQWTLGIVILIEAILFVMPGARHDFAGTHMPDAVRQILGWGEIVGAVLLLIPRTAVRGAWILAGTFLLAILIHLLHGMFHVESLLIYTAAAWAVAEGKGAQEI